jgi:GNAT superfamily N-acetyltransferase
MEIRPLDTSDDAAIRRFHEILWAAELEDGRPWNACWSLPEMVAVLTEPTDDQRTDGYCVVEGDRMVGAGVLMRSLLDNLDKAFVFPAVEPGLRGRGIGGALLEAMVEGAVREGRHEVLGDTAVPVAERETSGVLRFAGKHGFTVANTEVVRLLPLPVAPGLLDGLRAEAAPYHPGYTVETYVDVLPERYLASYCHLRNQLALDAPTGDVDFEAERMTPDIVAQKLDRNARAGRRTYLTLAVRDGEAVAHSDLYVLAGDTMAHQMGTLVRRDHRGHRLGAAVKVANLEALQRDRPDVTQVHTQNAEDNQWMVGINVRLGFEPVGVCPELVRRVPA